MVVVMRRFSGVTVPCKITKCYETVLFKESEHKPPKNKQQAHSAP